MQQRRSRGLYLFLAAVMGLTLAAPAWSAPQTDSQTQFQLAQNMQGKAVAVVDFENHTGLSNYDNLKRGLSESLMAKLSKRPELTLVERNQLEKAIKELGFSQSIYADGNQAKQIGKMTGADVLVTGDIVKAGNRFEINVRLIDVESAQILVADSYSFQSENDTLLVIDYLSLLIPQKMGLYVSDRELDMARQRLKQSDAMASNDMNWVWWVAGGVAVAAAIGIGVALAGGGAKQTNVVNIGGDGNRNRELNNN